ARQSDVKTNWNRAVQLMEGCGLFNLERSLDDMDPNNVLGEFNMRFADALSGRLGCLGRPAIDLLIVDEAQSLRNIDNQTNRVFYRVFRTNVRKWLLLSATPIHSSR